MKRYKVIAKLRINRENSLIIWAKDEEEAKKVALRKWGINPDMLRELKVEEGA